MSLEAHHRFILDTMQRNQDIARNIINELEAENARFKAEVEAQAKRWAESEDLILHYKQQMDEVINDCQCSRLKAEVDRLDTLCKQLGKQHSDISCENIMLRKAGNAMAEIFKNQMDNDPENVGYLQEQLVSRWNAAKEGKPSV